MKSPKDLFSGQSAAYRRFRPSYPARLLQDLLELTPGRERALDCATGNGQVARALAPFFDEVEAIDISREQLARAPQRENINYHCVRAESTPFPQGYFDLVCAAQAVHWFDIEAFHREARRLLRPGGTLAIWGYGLLRVDRRTDAWLDRFYREVAGPYWEPERRYVEAGYANLPFPWDELSLPGSYSIQREVELADIAGYLYSWSAIQHLLRIDRDPVPEWMESLRDLWGSDGSRPARHDLFVRVGRA